MKIIAIQHNPYTQSDFALYLKDNYDDKGLVSPPVNSDSLESTKSGLPLLKIEFWRNERFHEYFWRGESISYVDDDDSDFEKRGRPWPIFMEIYNSF